MYTDKCSYSYMRWRPERETVVVWGERGRHCVFWEHSFLGGALSLLQHYLYSALAVFSSNCIQRTVSMNLELYSFERELWSIESMNHECSLNTVIVKYINAEAGVYPLKKESKSALKDTKPPTLPSHYTTICLCPPPLTKKAHLRMYT